MATLVLAGLAALSGTYWVLKSTHADSVSTAAPSAGFAGVDPQALARALGGGGAVASAGEPVAVGTAYVLVKGDIDVQGPVVLDSSAIVMGNIKSKSVQINNGAVIEGMCSQCYADVSPTSFFDDYKPEKKKVK